METLHWRAIDREILRVTKIEFELQALQSHIYFKTCTVYTLPNPVAGGEEEHGVFENIKLELD